MERTGAWSAQLVELMCCMDERDKVQKKTFTKWMNQHLKKVRKHVNDLYEDLRDGHNLISLLEVLSGDTLPREEGRMRFHRLHNVQVALDYLKKHEVKLVDIRNDDIADGNPRLTLGLIWTIILHFQISDIHVTGESEDMSAKERLLLWSQQAAQGYAGMGCENFTTCWRDGRLFNAIIHKHRPDLIDMNSVAVQSNHANLEHAFLAAEKLGVARLLDPEDVDVSSPDEKSVITYVSSVHDAFLEELEDGEGIQTSLRSLTCFTCYITKSASQLKKKLKQEVEITLANKKANTTIKDLKYKLNETELQKSSTEEVSCVFKGKIDQVNSELKCLKLKLEEKEQAEQRYLQQLKDLGKQLCKVIDNAEEVMQENIDLKKINMNYEEKLKEKAQLKREVEELTLFQREAKITIKHLNSQISSLLKEKMEAERSTEPGKEAATNHQDQCKKIQEQLLKNSKYKKNQTLGNSDAEELIGQKESDIRNM